MISARHLMFLAASSLCAQTSAFDLVISGAKLVDGSGNPWYYADIGIRGDIIAAVGELGSAAAATRIDARGLVAAPGFIDIHSHARRGIFLVPTAENYLREGVHHGGSKDLTAVRPSRSHHFSTGSRTRRSPSTLRPWLARARSAARSWAL